MAIRFTFLQKLKNKILALICIFLVWRLLLFIAAFFGTILIHNFQQHFPYYNVLLEPTRLPVWIWGFGNFDGVHFLRIALMGYGASEFSQAFFPLYPLLIKLLTPGNYIFLAGLLISNISFLLSIFVIYKIFELDNSQKISLKSIILFLSIPTAFFFGSLYSESLFLLAASLSIYFIRKNNSLISSIFASLASLTRFVGILLWLVIVWELYLKIKSGGKLLFQDFLSLLVAPLGLVGYMYYLKLNFNNPIYFFSAQPYFGAGRGIGIVLLPQIIFRYAKILLSIPINSAAFVTASLEILFTLIPLTFLIVYFKRIRFSYWLFSFLSLILPTLTGTFSSMPRYALMIFLIVPALVKLSDRYFKLLVTTMLICELVLTALFVRGYWIA